MLIYMQMRWNIENRTTLDQVFDLELQEGPVAQANIKIVAMYKVAGQRRVLAIVDVESAETLDRVILGKLPLREYLEFEAIWPVRTFESFLEDCKTNFGNKRENSEVPLC
jgi:muconolactone D-isomerase